MNCSAEMFPKPITLEADIWVKGGDTLKVGNMELHFIHTPGHTKGGMCIYVDGNLFSGDTLFRYSIGRTVFTAVISSFNEFNQKEIVHAA